MDKSENATCVEIHIPMIKRAAKILRGKSPLLSILAQVPWILRRLRTDVACRNAHGLPSSVGALDAAHRSNTLFVLGSGASINRLPQCVWRRIEASDSIGFNNWTLHDFVPTFYVKESKCNYRAISEVARSMRDKRREYANVPFVLRGFKDGKRDDMLRPSDFPEELRANLSMPLHMDIPARSERELRLFLRLWRSLGLLRWRDVHLTCRASLSTLIYIGVIHGYRHIVLCGIDLNDSRYFWQDGNDGPPAYDLVPISEEDVRHKTLDPELGLPIDIVVKVFQEELLAPLGISLHVASETSALASFLPVYTPDPI